ncbi:MAG: GLPGLI family protein [Bacteroidota bacterium]|nr:GLPGLI family protein [Bacteroidota bacterium]MDE2957497.1 GLPGLI family protein [Bacteroidota bacterium]
MSFNVMLRVTAHNNESPIMRICLLIVFLLLPASAAAQNGVIVYSGQTTIKVSRDLLLSQLPESMRADTAMIEMILADMPQEGISTPMDWTARYSGQKVLLGGGVNMAQMPPDMGPAAPALTPYTGGLQSLARPNPEIYTDYDNGIVISSAHSVMGEPYVITTEVDSTKIMQWIPGSRDSTILGYTVREATSDVSPEQIQNVMDQLSTGMLPFADQAVSVESAEFTAWYAPEIPVPAGPMYFSGLPGAILHVAGQYLMAGSETVIEISADSIQTTLDRPVQPPTGIEISQEDYLELFRVQMGALQKQMENLQ